MQNLRIAIIVLFVSMCGVKKANAGVIYRFSGTTGFGGGAAVAGLVQNFTAFVPTYLSLADGTPGFCPGFGCILTSDIVAGTCVGCDPEAFGGIDTVAQFFPGYPTNNPTSDYVGFFVNSSSAEYLYYFPLGSFAQPGTYSTLPGGNVGTLVVSQTPEPSTLSYALLPLIGLFVFGRRRIIALPPAD